MNKTYPVTLDFSRWMSSAESAYVKVKSDLTGKTKDVRKARLSELPIEARKELVSFYPGCSASYAECENIKVQMTRETMMAIVSHDPWSFAKRAGR